MWVVRLRWFMVFLCLSISGFWFFALQAEKHETSSLTENSSFTSSSEKKESKERLKVRRLVLLSEYISGDYGVAVSDSGEVMDKDEFAEMQEFTSTIKSLYNELSRNSSKIKSQIADLEALVSQKSAPSLVSEKAMALSESLKEFHSLESHLKGYPNLELGKAHYEAHCASCHASLGDARTPLAETLKIPPRNFLEKEFVEKLSPSKVHNTLKLGIPDTGMISYEGILSEEEMWDVSFYVASLPFKSESSNSLVLSEKLRNELSWQDLADRRLGELRSFLEEISPEKTEEELASELSLLRNLNFTHRDLPFLDRVEISAPEDGDSLSYLLFTREKLAEARELFESQEIALVSHKILDAYLEGFENFERELKIHDAAKMKELERDFMELRGLATREPHSEKILLGLEHLEMKLLELEPLLGKARKKQSFSFFSDVLSSATIILREGVEAFLIVMALLALVNNLGVRRAKIWIHSAWILAILLGFLTYYLMNKVFELSGASRELLEAFFTGFAVLMLFYTGFWLLSQSGSRKWNQFVRGGSEEELSQGNLFAFFGLAFVAVYREAAETVLFYQALLSTASHVSSVVVGFFVGVLLLLALCLGILYYNIKIPMNKFFKLTSGLMFLLSFILIGKAVYELIEANYLTQTPWAFVPHFEALGLYPFRETTVAQFGLLLATAALLWRFRAKKKLRLEGEVEEKMAKA